jgi:hypothetical protein
MADDKRHTHTAFAFRREGKKFGRWLEVGRAMPDTGGMIRVLLDRLPIGGFNGGILLTPIGEPPPEMPKPDDGEEVTD